VPREGRHALQIEISRALYMDEVSMGRADGFEPLRGAIGVLIKALSRLPLDVLRPL
jgi:N-formylglutamate amidohydrolase